MGDAPFQMSVDLTSITDVILKDAQFPVQNRFFRTATNSRKRDHVKFSGTYLYVINVEIMICPVCSHIYGGLTVISYSIKKGKLQYFIDRVQLHCFITQ